MDDGARAIEVLALDAGRFEEFARKPKLIVGACDTGRPAPIAEPPSVALAIAKRSDYSHSYLSSQRRTPAHGCRPPRQAPGTRPGACGHQSRQMSLPLGQDSDRAVIAVRPEPLIRLVGLARPVRCRHPADVAGGAGRLVQILRQSVASRIGCFATHRGGRSEVAVHDGDIAAE